MTIQEFILKYRITLGLAPKILLFLEVINNYNREQFALHQEIITHIFKRQTNRDRVISALLEQKIIAREGYVPKILSYSYKVLDTSFTKELAKQTTFYRNRKLRAPRDAKLVTKKIKDTLDNSRKDLKEINYYYPCADTPVSEKSRERVLRTGDREEFVTGAFRYYSNYISRGKEERATEFFNSTLAEVDISNCYLNLTYQISKNDELRKKIMFEMSNNYFSRIARKDRNTMFFGTSREKITGFLIACREGKVRFEFDENFDHLSIKEKAIEIYSSHEVPKKSFLSFLNKSRLHYNNEDFAFRAWLGQEYPVFTKSLDSNMAKFGNAFMYWYATLFETYLMRRVIEGQLAKHIEPDYWQIVHDGVDCSIETADAILVLCNRLAKENGFSDCFTIKTTIEPDYYLDTADLFNSKSTIIKHRI